MTSDKEYMVKSSFTDIDSRGIYSNPDLISAYMALPNMQPRLAGSLFTAICKEVRYESGGVKDGYDFLSNIFPITIDSILMEVRSVAYSEGKKIENDRKNYRAQLADLHRGNVFYMWKCGKFYIFFMDREIRSWLYYNKNGCVLPKTIIKILLRARDMINDMIKFHADINSHYKISEIESSFGVFLNIMIDKMYHCIATGLPRWDNTKHVGEYMDELMLKMETLNPQDGLVEADDFRDRLPASVRENLAKREARGGYMISNIEKDIGVTGKAANLAKTPRKKRQPKNNKSDKDTHEQTKPEKTRYDKSINPFHDAHSLMEYYKASLQHLSGKINIPLGDIQVDSRCALEIIDLLRLSNLENKQFLNEWIKYFFEQKLKGEKIFKSKYTALSVFRYTFEAYKETYYVS
jgi:hypothetical protein